MHFYLPLSLFGVGDSASVHETNHTIQKVYQGKKKKIKNPVLKKQSLVKQASIL